MMNHKTKTTLAAAAAALFSCTVPFYAHAESAALAGQLVDALNTRYGVHPGYRANHAKGVVAEGTFTPSKEGVALTTSPIYSSGTLPVVVRFSDAGGMPNISDSAEAASPHGLAIKFFLPDGKQSDIVVNSLKFFTVATPQAFGELQVAVGESPAGSPQPTKLQVFLKSHPSVQKANATLGHPDSFADEHYYGINAFIFTNQAGKEQPFRYIIQPDRLVHISEQDAAAMSPDYLFEELPARLAKGPVTFHILAQLAAPGDPTNDATKAWPQDRKVVDLGVLSIAKVVPNSDQEERKLLFVPGNLTVGISPSDDPIIAARDSSYAVSYARYRASN